MGEGLMSNPLLEQEVEQQGRGSRLVLPYQKVEVYFGLSEEVQKGVRNLLVEFKDILEGILRKCLQPLMHKCV